MTQERHNLFFRRAPEKRLSQSQAKAMFLQAGQRIRWLADEKTKDVASAVPIRLGRRCFLVTAAHFIAEHPTPLVVREEGARDVPLGFVRVVCGDPDNEDVAALEMTQDQARTLRDCADEKSILVRWDRRYPRAVLVSGFPVQAVLHRGPKFHGGTGNVDGSRTVPSRRWPRLGVDSIASCKRDIIIEFATNGGSFPLYGTELLDVNRLPPSDHTDPRGMSGGGVWLSVSRERRCGIWAPNLQLVGIQVGWQKDARVLRAVLIEKLLDLLDLNYPDLDEAIERVRRRRIRWRKPEPRT